MLFRSSLANHPFMGKLVTPTQRKNGTDRDLIIQALMLICTNNENEFTSFRNKDIDVFVMDYADNSLEKVSVLLDALDSFDESFEEIKIPVTSIPMLLYCGYRVKKDKKSFSKLVEIVDEFLNGYDSNEEYKQYVQSGTSAQENVRGRFDYWKGLMKAI